MLLFGPPRGETAAGTGEMGTDDDGNVISSFFDKCWNNKDDESSRGGEGLSCWMVLGRGSLDSTRDRTPIEGTLCCWWSTLTSESEARRPLMLFNLTVGFGMELELKVAIMSLLVEVLLSERMRSLILTLLEVKVGGKDFPAAGDDGGSNLDFRELFDE